MENFLTYTSFSPQYQSASALAEMPPRPPNEEQLQAVWFEHWMRPVIETDEGVRIEIVQPGNWNHGAGPDFLQAAIRLPDGTLRVGAVELHLRAGDWDAHGHHTDPAYNETILHVVWETPTKTFFPATENFRHVPQVILKEQLLAPWEQVRGYISPLIDSRPLPAAQPGRCQRWLATQPTGTALNLLRAAGAFRLNQKAERLGWRIDAVGEKQTLWEALAEGLGYSANKIPFRLLAQRLPYAMMLKLTREQRLARIFGLSGLLPATSLEAFDPEVREWIKPQWEHWWKIRARYDYAILPRSPWKLSGLRPWNRPERRLAAMAELVPRLSRLHEAVAARDADAFRRLLDGIHDPFWDRHTTFTARSLSKPHHLIGAERINDLLLNVFWPLVHQANASTAIRGWHESESAANSVTELARQRVLGGIELKPHLHETLVQQGLLQIYHDYCRTDASACADCPFPKTIGAE